MDNVQRFESMADRSRGIYGQILQREIQDDGTIVEMRHGETAIEALRRHARVRGRHDVRAWQTHSPLLFHSGFFYLDPPRIKVANFEARQAWQHTHGPLPISYIETPDEFDPKGVFDETIGAMVGRSELASRGASTTGDSSPADPDAGQPQPPIDGPDEVHDEELTPAEQQALADANGIPDFGKGAP